MPYEKTIVCLAGSWRKGGRCFAGRTYENGVLGEWIRPVGAKDNHEIKSHQIRKDNGEPTAVIDIVSITFDTPDPCKHQTENHRISKAERWRHVGRINYEKLLESCDWRVRGIWEHEDGAADCLPAYVASRFDYSLLLRKVADLEIDVSYRWGKKRQRASFCYEGQQYNLAVTDPWIESRYNSIGSYSIGEAILCISLAEPYKDGQCYKLVASIIVPERN